MFYVRDDVSRITTETKQTLTKNKVMMQKRFLVDTRTHSSTTKVSRSPSRNLWKAHRRTSLHTYLQQLKQHHLSEHVRARTLDTH